MSSENDFSLNSEWNPSTETMEQLVEVLFDNMTPRIKENEMVVSSLPTSNQSVSQHLVDSDHDLLTGSNTMTGIRDDVNAVESIVSSDGTVQYVIESRDNLLSTLDDHDIRNVVPSDQLVHPDLMITDPWGGATGTPLIQDSNYVISTLSTNAKIQPQGVFEDHFVEPSMAIHNHFIEPSAVIHNDILESSTLTQNQFSPSCIVSSNNSEIVGGSTANNLSPRDQFPQNVCVYDSTSPFGSITTNTRVQEPVMTNTTVKFEEKSLSSISGEVEQIVQIPKGVRPSTKVAMQVHDQLKKTGKLTKAKNTVVYLVSTKSSQSSLPGIISPVTTSSSYIKTVPTLSHSVSPTLPGISSFMPKGHTSFLSQPMTYVSLPNGKENVSGEISGLTTGASHPSTQVTYSRIQGPSQLIQNQALPSIDSLMKKAASSVPAKSIARHMFSMQSTSTGISPMDKYSPSTGMVTGTSNICDTKEKYQQPDVIEQVNKADKSAVGKNTIAYSNETKNMLPKKVAYIIGGTVNHKDVIVETTEIKETPSLKSSDEQPSRICIKQYAPLPRASLRTSESSFASPALSSHMKAKGQLDTVTLPLMAPPGVKLPAASKPAQYFPVLCQLAPGTKSFSSSKQSVPVLLLQRSVADAPTTGSTSSMSAAVQWSNCAQNFTTKTTAVSTQSSAQYNKAISPQPDIRKLEQPTLHHVAIDTLHSSNGKREDNKNDEKGTGDAKAGSSVCMWQIKGGELTKPNSSVIPVSSATAMPSKIKMRLPLGTGLAPSIVTRDDGSHVFNAKISTSARNTRLPQQETNKLRATLKELLHEKRKMMPANIYHVQATSKQHMQSQVKMFTTPNIEDKNQVENVISHHPYLFDTMCEYKQRKIAYAYEIEGLDYTPALLLANSNACIDHIAATGTCSAVETAIEGSEHMQKPLERFELDISLFARSSLKMKENRQLALNSGDAVIMQENRLAKELNTDYDTTGGEEVCLSYKDIDNMENIDTSLKHTVSQSLPNLITAHGQENNSANNPVDSNSANVAHSDVLDHDLKDTPIQNIKDLVKDESMEMNCKDLNGAVSGMTRHVLGINIDGELGIDFLDGVPFVNGVEIGMPKIEESVDAFCCYICGFCAFDTGKITQHWLSSHVSEKPYLCAVCRSAAFSNSYNLMNHIKAYHSSFKSCMPMMLKPSEIFENPLVMVVGKDENISDSRLNAVWQKVDNMVDVDCDPEDSTADVSNLRLYCNNCAFSCDTVLDMRAHMSGMHPKSFCFSCPECQRLFTCRFDLVRHKRVIHGTTDEADDIKDVFNLNAQTKVSVKISGGFMDWNKVCQARIDASIPGNSPRLECLICRNRGLRTLTPTAKIMWMHLEQIHKWPSHVYCNTCAMKIRVLDIERKEKRTCCPACCHVISLDPIITEESLMDMSVYICKACNYKTMERSSMYRHVKYSYANFRPYICPYCTYASVEKAKVKRHVLINHSTDRPLVKINLEAIQDMKERIDPLMAKVTMKVKYHELDLLLGEDESLHSCEWNQKFLKQYKKAQAPLDELTMGSEEYKSSMQVHKNKTGQVTYHCKDCDFVALSLLGFSRHRRQVHRDLRAPNVMTSKQKSKVMKTSRLSGQHFQCNICRYCCLDRSSMTRHIKYMHMHERPHACPYCGYKNVEKTKVRIHVISSHHGSPAYVNSDAKILKMMSLKVKGNYTKILKNPGMFQNFILCTDESFCNRGKLWHSRY